MRKSRLSKAKQDRLIEHFVACTTARCAAANVAINKQKKVSGLVLTSSVTRPGESRYLKKLAKKYPDGVAGMNLKKFKKPVLIVSH